MNGALRKAMSEIGHGVDPRAWAHVHPWLTLAAASVAGFVTAAAVVPSEEDQLLKRLKKLEKSLDDSKYQKEAERRKDAATDGKKSRGTLVFIGSEIFKIVRPMVVSMLSAAIAPAVGGDEKDAAAASAAATADPAYDETAPS